jgi:hypothetical protein
MAEGLQNARERLAKLQLRAGHLLPLHVAFVLLLYRGVRRSWGQASHLHTQVFRADFPLLEALTTRRALIFFVASLIVGLLLRRTTWRSFGGGARLRWVFIPIAVILIWDQALGTYNLLFNEYFFFERALILGLGVLVLGRPSWIPMLLTVCVIFWGQYDKGPGVAPSWTDKRLLVDVTMLFSAWLVARIVLRARTRAFVVAALVVIGGAYYRPFFDKIYISPSLTEWLLENQLGNLHAAAHINGWLAGFDDSTILAIADVANSGSVLLGGLTLVIEAAGLIILMLPRRWVPWLLLSFAFLHLGIFAASGIFFWKWITVDTAFAIYIWRARRDDLTGLPLLLRLGCVVVIALAPWTLQPPKLSWYDTRVEQTVEIVAVDAEGRECPVPRLEFKPYDLLFAQSRFYFLYDVPQLIGTYGAANGYARFEKLQAMTEPAEVEAMLDRKPRPRRGKKHKSGAFDRFMMRWFQNWEAHGRTRPLTWIPHTPAHIMTWLDEDTCLGQARVEKVRAELSIWLHTDDAILPVQRRVIREVRISYPKKKKKKKPAQAR